MTHNTIQCLTWYFICYFVTFVSFYVFFSMCFSRRHNFVNTLPTTSHTMTHNALTMTHTNPPSFHSVFAIIAFVIMISIGVALLSTSLYCRHRSIKYSINIFCTAASLSTRPPNTCVAILINALLWLRSTATGMLWGRRHVGPCGVRVTSTGPTPPCAA